MIYACRIKSSLARYLLVSFTRNNVKITEWPQMFVTCESELRASSCILMWTTKSEGVQGTRILVSVRKLLWALCE